MKVLVAIFEKLVPVSGGGTPRISNVIKAFVKKGHRVYVASSIGVKVEKAIKELGCFDLLPLTNVSRLDMRKTLKYLYVNPLNMLRVVKYARRIGPDMIVSHNSIAGFTGLLAKGLRRNCLAILDLTDLLFEYLEDYQSRGWVRLIQFLGRKLEKKVIKESDKIITISNAMRNILLIYGAQPENMEVVCDGVDTGVFNYTDEIELRNKLAGRAVNVIIFQGVIDPQDDPEIILSAAKEVVVRYPKTRFWIVGDGTAMPSLKEKVSRNRLAKYFYFSGWVSQREVSKYISASDIGLVILPNVLSARGRVTLKEFEYWACGIPVIVPCLPALEEVVEEGKTGLFYEPGDPIDLARKISLLIGDEKMRKRMGQKGREMVKKNYEWGKLADCFVEICEGLL